MKKVKTQNQKMTRVEGIIDISKEIKKEEKSFEKLMFIYSAATKEIEAKLNILKEESKLFYHHDLIEHITTRIKKPESILKKMEKRNYDITYKEMIRNINDVAGVRVVCPLKNDIFTVRNLIEKMPGIRILKEKDYVTYPKESGYSSYHLIVEVPVYLSQNKMFVKVEIQIRSIAMDIWASLEHKMKYKPEGEIDKKKSKEWINCAKMIYKLDNKIMLLSE